VDTALLGQELETLGHRFISYARRMKTIRINFESREECRSEQECTSRRQVSPRVLSLWSRLGSSGNLFPRFSSLLVRTPRFGAPWDVQDILNFMSTTPMLEDLWWEEMSYGIPFADPQQENLQSSTSLSCRLKITGCYQSSFPGPALLDSLLSHSSLLQHLEIYGPFCIHETSNQIALFPYLTSLHLRWCEGYISKLPVLPPGAFARLEVLEMWDSLYPSPMLHLFMAIHPHNNLLSLIYYHKGMPSDHNDFPYLDCLTHRASQWTALQSLELDFTGTSAAHYLSVAESRAFFSRFQALPALKSLKLTSQVCFRISTRVISDVLDWCPCLMQWMMDWRGNGRTTRNASISFRELLDLILDRPHVSVLPVTVRCDSLPAPDELGGFEHPSFSDLSVHAIGDPTALGTLLATIFPDMYWFHLRDAYDPILAHEDWANLDLAMDVFRDVRARARDGCQPDAEPNISPDPVRQSHAQQRPPRPRHPLQPRRRTARLAHQTEPVRMTRKQLRKLNDSMSLPRATRSRAAHAQPGTPFHLLIDG
jgi:hypothetical protein